MSVRVSLLGVVVAAALFGCSGDDEPASLADFGLEESPTPAADAAASPDAPSPTPTPPATPTPAPTPTPTPTLAPTPTPAPAPTPTEVPTGPDDDGWAEHLGVTEDELEELRASDKFLEWAEPRRARDAPGVTDTLQGFQWYELEQEQRLDYVNQMPLWIDLAAPFRDQLLARGEPPSTDMAIPGRDRNSGYLYRVMREAPDDLQRYVLFGFYVSEQQDLRVLVDQVAIRLEGDQGSVVGKIEKRRELLLDESIDAEWAEVHEERLASDLLMWADSVEEP